MVTLIPPHKTNLLLVTTYPTCCISSTGGPLSDTGSPNMSVLNISEDMVECPLCMEPLEMDDLNFFPCTCGYQICRFCWHRIRTDENGLCPACRKAYPENPADFKPLSHEEYVFACVFVFFTLLCDVDNCYSCGWPRCSVINIKLK